MGMTNLGLFGPSEKPLEASQFAKLTEFVRELGCSKMTTEFQTKFMNLSENFTDNNHIFALEYIEEKQANCSHAAWFPRDIIEEKVLPNLNARDYVSVLALVLKIPPILILFLVGFILNAVTLNRFRLYVRMTKYRYKGLAFVVALLLIEIVTLTFSAPLSIIPLVARAKGVNAHDQCTYSNIFNYVVHACAVTELLFLTFIAISRSFAKNVSVIKKEHTLTQVFRVLLVVGISCLLSAPFGLQYSVIDLPGEKNGLCVWRQVSSIVARFWIFYKVGLLFILPLILTGLSYVRVFKKVNEESFLELSTRMPIDLDGAVNFSTLALRAQHERHVKKTSCIYCLTTVIYMIFWLPYLCYNTWSFLERKVNKDTEGYFIFVSYFRCLGPAIVFLYNMRKRNAQKEVVERASGEGLEGLTNEGIEQTS